MTIFTFLSVKKKYSRKLKAERLVLYLLRDFLVWALGFASCGKAELCGREHVVEQGCPFSDSQSKSTGIRYSLWGRAPEDSLPPTRFRLLRFYQWDNPLMSELSECNHFLKAPHPNVAALETKPWTRDYEPLGDIPRPAITINQLSWWALSTIYNQTRMSLYFRNQNNYYLPKQIN